MLAPKLRKVSQGTPQGLEAPKISDLNVNPCEALRSLENSLCIDLVDSDIQKVIYRVSLNLVREHLGLMGSGVVIITVSINHEMSAIVSTIWIGMDYFNAVFISNLWRVPTRIA